MPECRRRLSGGIDMASRIMHFAMAQELCQRCNIEDPDRFSLGMLLPDAVVTGNKKTAGTHFDRMTDSTHKVMDFSLFYEKFEEQVNTDELYLGYYLHLIEDCVFRKYIYYGLGLLELRGKEGFLEQLYRDYHSVNGYLAEKYEIIKLPPVPKELGGEVINEIYPFEADRFLSDMRGDISDRYYGDEKYFTAKNAEEVIRLCVNVCAREIEALGRGEHFTAPDEYIWEAKK